MTNTTFRLQYAVPENTFTDKDYKSVNDLTMYLYAHNGDVLPLKSWIFLTAQTINVYSAKAIYSQQPSGGYKFRLSAIDLFGHDNYTTLIVKFTGPITEPNYLRTIVSNVFFLAGSGMAMGRYGGQLPPPTFAKRWSSRFLQN